MYCTLRSYFSSLPINFILIIHIFSFGLFYRSSFISTEEQPSIGRKDLNDEVSLYVNWFVNHLLKISKTYLVYYNFLLNVSGLTYTYILHGKKQKVENRAEVQRLKFLLVFVILDASVM